MCVSVMFEVRQSGEKGEAFGFVRFRFWREFIAQMLCPYSVPASLRHPMSHSPFPIPHSLFPIPYDSFNGYFHPRTLDGGRF